MEIERLGREVGVDAKFERKSSLELTLERPVELLFIDSLHTYAQLSAELERHWQKVTGCIVLHDTETFGVRGEDGKEPGLWGAVEDFLKKHSEWRVKDRLRNNNGLTILARSR